MEGIIQDITKANLPGAIVMIAIAAAHQAKNQKREGRKADAIVMTIVD
jgi:hypothetical protein